MNIFSRALRAIFSRNIGRELLRVIIRKGKIGTYKFRVATGAVERPQYAYCLYHAASLAKQLGHVKISVIEFGVAAGKGLLCLEDHAREIEKIFGIEVQIYGFDTGEGLPEPEGYRDLTYHWEQGFFKMDVHKLEQKLTKSKLVFGNVKNTVKDFFARYEPAPIGAIFHDLDFYSSTRDAMIMLDEKKEFFLPRVYNYFDDIIGTEIELYNDYTGERLAIEEFNQLHKDIKFSPAYHLTTRSCVESWYHQIRILHFFTHDKYNEFVSESNQQSSLNQ